MGATVPDQAWGDGCASLQGRQCRDPRRVAKQPALRIGDGGAHRGLSSVPMSDSTGLRAHTKERSMQQVLKNERGMALAIAIVALVVVGALIAGALFSGTQEQRVAENVRRAQASFGVAEEGVYDIIRTWDSTIAGGRMQVGDSLHATPGTKITGSVPVIHDPTLKDSAFSVYGDVTFAQLAAAANITLPGQNFSNGIAPVVTNGACDYSVQTNWGSPTAPTGPCGSYFPIIYINGDTQINGLEGQGVLLINGGLVVQGGFQFYGVTIIKGSIRTAGGGGTPAHFWGALMAQDTVQFADTTNNLAGGATMLYSKCAIIKSLNKVGSGAMMRSRGWVQLF